MLERYRLQFHPACIPTLPYSRACKNLHVLPRGFVAVAGFDGVCKCIPATRGSTPPRGGGKTRFSRAVALVADEGGVLYKTAVGALTYGQKTPLGQPNSALSISSSIFDMASCTKVIATTSAISLLFQGNYFGEKGLQTKVGSVLGTEYNINGKTEITIENCLLHNAGFPPGTY